VGGTEGPCLPCGREGSHKCKMAEPINKKISTECTDSPGRILRSSATVDTVRADDYVDVIQGAAQQANPSSSVEIPNYRLQSNMHQGQSNHAPSLCLCIGKDGGHRKNAYLGQRAARSAVVAVEAGAAPGRCNDTSHVAAHNGLYTTKRVLLVSLSLLIGWIWSSALTWFKTRRANILHLRMLCYSKETSTAGCCRRKRQ